MGNEEAFLVAEHTIEGSFKIGAGRVIMSEGVSKLGVEVQKGGSISANMKNMGDLVSKNMKI